MGLPTFTTIVPQATTAPELMLAASGGLRGHAQRPALGRTASRVLWQLCTAPRQCHQGRGSLQQQHLQRLFDQAGAIAEAADRAFPEWIPGAVWTRDAYPLDAVRAAWRLYRRARALRSHELDRMLLETLICADLRRAGVLVRVDSSAPAAGYGGFFSAKGLALSALTAAALAGALNPAAPDAVAAAFAHPLELPLLSAATAVAGCTLWEPLGQPQRTRAVPTVDALRRCFAPAKVDSRALGEPLRDAVRAGVVWSGETLQVLVRMRMNGLPAPAVTDM